MSNEHDDANPFAVLASTYSGLIVSAWRRKGLIAFGVILGLLLGGLYFARKTRIYESSAQVLIVNKRADTGIGLSSNTHMSHFEDYVSTHRVLVRSPLIVERAIAKDRLGELKCLQILDDDLTTEIIDRLSVQRVVKEAGAKNSILGLSFRGTVPEECAIVVNSIVASYKDFLDETYRNMSDDTLKLVGDARDSLAEDLAKKEEEYRKFRASAPLIWKSSGNEENRSPLYLRLAQMEHEQAMLRRRRIDLEDRLAALNKGIEEKLSLSELLELVNSLAGEPEQVDPGRERESASGDSQLLQLILEEQTLLGEFGKNHPQVQSVRKRIDATRRHAAMPSASFVSTGTMIDSGDGVDYYVRYLKHEIGRVDRNLSTISKALKSDDEVARDLASFELRDEQLRSGIARTQELFEAIVKRLQDVSLVRDYGGFEARPIAVAGIGEIVSPKATSVFPIAGFLGAMLGIGLGVIAEATDKSFRSPEEMRRRLGLTVIAHVPYISVEAAAKARLEHGNLTIDPMLTTVFMPRSSHAEAYRGLRTAIYFSPVGEGHKSIQVTSSNMGEGKSTLCANLAVSMAQSGKRVILVDADLRRPRQHDIFSLSGKVGLSDLLTGRDDLADAIHSTGVPGLSLVPAGPLSENPAELLTSPRFQELLGALKEKCDYLLIDSPPLLAVSDPCAVAARVDGVILVVNVTKEGCEAALRSKEVLASMKAKTLGIVVNRTRDAASTGFGENYKSYEYSSQYYHDDEKAEREAYRQAN